MLQVSNPEYLFDLLQQVRSPSTRYLLYLRLYRYYKKISLKYSINYPKKYIYRKTLPEKGLSGVRNYLDSLASSVPPLNANDGKLQSAVLNHLIMC